MFCFLSVWLIKRIEARVKQIDDDTSTPADFTVYVRGLPPDVPQAEIVTHFSALYDLSRAQAEFPIMGLSPGGVAVVYGVVIAVLFYIILGPSLGATLGGLGALVGLGSSVFVGLVLGITSYCMKIGDARRLSTPLERWTETERHVGNYRQSQSWAEARRESVAKKRAERKELSAVIKKNKVLPETVHDAVTGQAASDSAAAAYAAEAELPAEESPGAPAIPSPELAPNQNIRHNGRVSCLGSWVADLSVVHPNGKILKEYKSREKSVLQVKKLRSHVQRWSSGTAERRGPNEKKREKYVKKLEKLDAKLESVHERATKAAGDPTRLLHTQAAFVTFAHEESKARAVTDYRGSSSWFGRKFQPEDLKLSWNGKDYPLQVEQAPEPGDIRW